MSMWIISRGDVLLILLGLGYRVLKDLILHCSSINNSASLSNKFKGFYFIFKFDILDLLHQVITTIADRIRDNGTSQSKQNFQSSSMTFIYKILIFAIHSYGIHSTKLKIPLKFPSMTFIYIRPWEIIQSFLEILASSLSYVYEGMVSKDKRAMLRLDFKICAKDKNFSSIWTYTKMMLPRVRNHHGGKCVHPGLS
ncbi:hypothetical protein Tco_1428410 [Tanacetum coccineum]